MGIKSFLRNRMFHDRNMRAMLNELQKQLRQVKFDVDEQIMQYQISRLRDKTLHSRESAVCSELYCEHEIVVSLTTFGERIHNAHLAIESIMQGTIRPNRIILWLAEKEFEDKRLPLTLLRQQKRGLEIEFCRDLKSYNKLIPSLQRYPDAAIITIDDDVIYEYDLVERLVNAHIDHPEAICACRMHRIVLDSTNNPVSYLDWDFCVNDSEVSSLNFPTGVGGVLYPPHCFNNEVFNDQVFTDICPKADDIWFYAMAQLNGIHAIWVKTPRPEGYYHILPDADITLNSYNTNPSIRGNDIQFRRVCDRYNTILNQMHKSV